MSGRNQIDGLIAEFGKIIGIEMLVLDEEKALTLAFDDQVVNMQYSEEQNRLTLFSDLGKIPDSIAQQLYKELLTANFYRERISNAAFSFCDSTGSIVLILSQSVEGLDIRQFDELMENFTNLAISWNLRIRQGQKESKEKKPGANDNNQGNWISV